ncbi:centrosomal protein of 112 kDa-like isoform X3 [Haliotis rufescens]|uniref:centrosomal protein of 112 kDa-like isoform X3 n=1 Tax=Haliotis rufescens TaxID=6454 RepID=UPI00201F9174|nr:centrosomal protein of 112 kDa-like isoform X3 [Haliotis rufescens]
MESPESSLEHLDSEFDKVLADMKPYVLKLPHKADRQRCAVWIKKLCEPPAAGVTGRKNRNMYGQLMLHMLRRGVLEGPFDKRPSGGSLPTLPPYMSIYFDEPMTGTDGQAREGDKVPDWVNGELLESVGSSMVRRSLGNPAATSTWLSGSSTAAHDVRERPYSSLGVSLDKDPSLSPPWRRPEGGAVGSLLTSDMDWSKPYSSTTSLGSSLAKGTTFQDDSNIGRGGAREIELRTKMVEAKYHEEKLKLQQRHDAAVQKILDRKNAEIEDVKSHYRGKAKDSEDTTTKLERKIQSLVKEMSMMRDMKDRQLADLKKLVDDTSDSRKNEYDKKLHDTTAHFEQEKFEMQKQHTRNIQEILDDTNARLQRMEKEYTQQMSSNTNVIRELESRVQQLTSEVEQQLKTRSGLEEEKTSLQDTCDQLTAQLGDVRDSYNQLDREHQHLQESHEHEMRTLKHKTEASLEFLKQEHTLAAAKAADAVGDMEQQLESMRRSMKESDEHRQKQLRELDQARQQEKLHLENLHDKQIRSMKKELEQLEQESQKKIRTSEHLLQEKDLTIHRLQEQNQNQALSAERALEEFKAEVEKNQNRVYEEMKQQMTQVESDLNKSKHSREKQNKELSKQLEQERVKFNREITEMKISFEHERSQMLHDLHLQKEYILSEHEKAVETLKEGHRVELRSLEARYRERGDKDTKNLTEFESQVRELREELVQSNQLRKQQLVELGLLREEEKQKMLRDHEAEMGRMRSDMEQQRLELQKLHSSEMETMLEKTNQRLKDIEREYADRGQKSTEVVADLQAATNQLREEIKRIRQQCDLRMTELAAQHEQDKKAMKKQYATNVTALQKELDSQRNKCRNMERQLQRLEADQEEKITKLKLSNEERMRGLMPAVVRQELEDTIRSLRSQVNSLQQRAAVLQDELDLKIKNPLGPFGTLTSSPIIKSSV